MKASDVYYNPREPVDYEPFLTMLDDLMNIGELGNIAKVCFTVTLKGAMDDAYRQGREHEDTNNG